MPAIRNQQKNSSPHAQIPNSKISLSPCKRVKSAPSDFNDVFTLDLAAPQVCDRGTLQAQRPQSPKFTHSISHILGFPLRCAGQVLASVLPLSVITDALIYPAWSNPSKPLGIRPFRTSLHSMYGGKKILIPIQNHRAARVCGSKKHEHIDGMFFISSQSPTAKTVIFCPPNAAVYEEFPHVVDFYQNHLGLNVLLFNYRGVGDGSGRPTTTRTLQDMESIYQWLQINKGIPDKDILVHGYSLGAVHAASLASKHPNMTLVCDRAFPNLLLAGYGMAGGSIRGSIVGALAYIFSSNKLSTHTFYRNTAGRKLCIADRHDQMFNNYRGSGGELLELNSNIEQTHTITELTFDSPLYSQWVKDNFIRC